MTGAAHPLSRGLGLCFSHLQGFLSGKDAVCRSTPSGTAWCVVRGALSSLTGCSRAWLWGACEGGSRRLCRVPRMAPTWPARVHTAARPAPRHPGRVPCAEETSRLSATSPFELSLRRWPVGTHLGGHCPGQAGFLWEAVPRGGAAGSLSQGGAHRSSLPGVGLCPHSWSPLSSWAAQPRGSLPCPVLSCCLFLPLVVLT